MDNSNKVEFAEMFNGLSEYYQRAALSVPAIQIYFAALQRFEISQVSQAITSHIQDPKAGQFYPKASDIVGYIEGGGFTADQIIAMARLKNTVLGVLCAQHIGSWNLASGDPFLLKQVAEECIQLLPTWKSIAKTGDYADHTLQTLLKYNVDPGGPFAIGQQRPQTSIELQQRVSAIHEKGDRERLLIEHTEANKPVLSEEEEKTIQRQNVNAMQKMCDSMLGDNFKTAYEPSERSPCKRCGVKFESVLVECPDCGESR